MDPEKVEKVLDARVEATDNEKLEVSEKEAQRRQDVIIATRGPLHRVHKNKDLTRSYGQILRDLT